VLAQEQERWKQQVAEQVPLEEVPVHFQIQRRDRQLGEEGLEPSAVAEGTFVVAAAGEELGHTDCFVDSKGPMLPFLDPPEEVLAAVVAEHQRGHHIGEAQQVVPVVEEARERRKVPCKGC